jgi:MFS family permease
MSLSHFIHHYMLYAFPSLIILLVEDIQLTYLEIGILGTVPIMVMALTSPVIGRLGKKAVNGFVIILVGIFLFSISSLVFAMSGSFADLLLGNILLGFGATAYHPVGLGVCANCFTTANRGKAMSVNHALGVIGTAASPVGSLSMGIFVLADWRSTFLVFGLACDILALVMIAWLISQRLIMGYDMILENSERNSQTPASINNSKITGSRKSYRNWILITIGILLIIHALRSGVYRCLSYFTVTLLKNFYNVSQFDSGVWTSLILLVGAVSDVGGATLSDSRGPLGRLKIIILSAAGTALAIMGLIMVTGIFPYLWAVLLGFGSFAVLFYLAGGTLQALMSDVVPAGHRTFFYSIVFSIGLIVSSVSPTIFGSLLDLFQSPIGGLFFLLVLISLSGLVALFFWKRLEMMSRNGLLAS